MRGNKNDKRPLLFELFVVDVLVSSSIKLAHFSQSDRPRIRPELFGVLLPADILHYNPFVFRQKLVSL